MPNTAQSNARLTLQLDNASTQLPLANESETMYKSTSRALRHPDRTTFNRQRLDTNNHGFEWIVEPDSEMGAFTFFSLFSWRQTSSPKATQIKTWCIKASYKLNPAVWTHSSTQVNSDRAHCLWHCSIIWYVDHRTSSPNPHDATVQHFYSSVSNNCQHERESADAVSSPSRAVTLMMPFVSQTDAVLSEGRGPSLSDISSMPPH